MDRIAAFLSFIERAPDDPFPRYGLAMEYVSQGRIEEARQTFAALVEAIPGYLATYLMYGNTLASLDETEAAASIYRRGIEVAAAAGDHHTRGEIEAALAGLDLE